MWQSIGGYVMIQMEGSGLERFLNVLLQADIPVWNIRRTGAVQMTAEVRVKDFFRIHSLQKGRRCRIHVLKRRGMPFLLAKFRKRKTLLIGVALFAVLMFIAQTRIWVIDVQGLNEVPLSVVEEALQAAKVETGMSRLDLETIALGDAIRAHDERIAWAGVQVDGIALHVQIVEADVIPELPDKSQPADVVAVKDGIIERVTALSGKSGLMPGDAVRKGDVLIRGDITREGALERLLVHAEGEVLAKVWYIVGVTLADAQKKWMPTGKEEPYRALYVAGLSVYESQTGYEKFKIEIERDRVVRGLVLPVRQVRGAYQELSLQDVPAEREELVAEAFFMAELQALGQVPEDARIIEKANALQEMENGDVQAVVRVCALEQIGERRPIT